MPKALSEPLLSGAAVEQRLFPDPRVGAILAAVESVAGMLMVTAAALLFGVVAAFVKATALPTLVMLQCRSMLEWAIGVSVAVLYARSEKQEPIPVLPPAEIELALDRQNTRMKQAVAEPSSSLGMLLFGPGHLFLWLVLRAFLYWAFMACWWLSLTSMPIGDATTIVYSGPIFTATFARIFLNERIDWTFYPVVVLDAIGLMLITRPGFLFGEDSGATSGDAGDSYVVGAGSALLSAIIAGLLPVCTRISKECSWTAVNHVSSLLSAFLFTPVAFTIWFSLDNTAWQQTLDSLGQLADTSGPSADGPGGGKWVFLLGATLTGFAGLALQTLGYQREEAAKASVMTILEIPFAYALQHVFFHEEITALGMLGVLFVGSGTLLNLLRQLSRSRAATLPEAEP